MKTLQNRDEILFNAIPLWELVAFFLVNIPLLFVLIEYVFTPILGHGTASGIYSLFIVVILGFLFQAKRMKKISIQLAGSEGYYCISKNQPIKNLNVFTLLFKKIPACILKLNQKLFLVSPVQKSMFDTITKEQKINFKKDIDTLKHFSQNTLTHKI